MSQRVSAREDTVALSAEFTDPRLVAVYDTLNPYSPGTQPDFYLDLAREVGATTVVEVGCGTGLITVECARAGFDTIGVEPSGQMLQIARRRAGANLVRWIPGGVEALDVREVDLVFMAGHVAQFFLTDEAWRDAVTAIRAALRSGGRLAFETRNPARRAWEGWTPAATRRTAIDQVAGEIETWTEVEDVIDGTVTALGHYRFVRSGQEITVRSGLRFRSPQEIERSLRHAGFLIESLYGGWDRHPFTDEDDEVVVVARAG
ncbi:methyltransferase domain-containing protein [Candidatus Nephthysia bennettiae]|uniref:Methyltransferase domain-containing protein n=1 Tax=Candidatus Nephthysia bennettiae TaxID=3127016 RepID=A0A934NAB8_9BACT|nr:methyltransferase domain-containing protein [Candidatus Dormibacteraeota bacterium]